jgi:ribonuclease T1
MLMDGAGTMLRITIANLLILLSALSTSALAAQSVEHRSRASWTERAAESDVPPYASETLEYIQEYHAPPPGYEGGRVFGNYARTLPMQDRAGHKIRYQEWDVKPHVEHRNRGPERIITGSDGRAWYTRDHYRTFIPMR